MYGSFPLSAQRAVWLSHGPWSLSLGRHRPQVLIAVRLPALLLQALPDLPSDDPLPPPPVSIVVTIVSEELEGSPNRWLGRVKLPLRLLRMVFFCRPALFDGRCSLVQTSGKARSL